MLRGQIKEIELRKSALLKQSQAWRRDFETELQPIYLWVEKAEHGFRLAREAKDLLLALTPILLATPKPQGNRMKVIFGLFSNWPLLKAVWDGFCAVRAQSR
jgi:hypothetical protein